MNLWVPCWHLCSLSPTRASVTELSDPNNRWWFKGASLDFSMWRFPFIGCDHNGSVTISSFNIIHFSFTVHMQLIVHF